MPQSPDTTSDPARLQLHPKYAKSERLGRQIMEYKAWMNAAEYKWLMMVREFDQEGLWQHEGICSCAHWLNWKCGIGMNAAREKVRVANALAGLPKLSARYAKGEISYSKARAISRIATPENEDYLLMIARHGTAAHVEGLVRKYRSCKRLQDRRNAREQHAGRELNSFYDDDGSLVIRGRFPPEEGALVLRALKLAMDRRDKEIEAERRRLREAAKAAAETTTAPPDVSAETPLDDSVSAEISTGDRVSAETPADTGLSAGAFERARIGSIRRSLREHPDEAARPAEAWRTREADALVALAESYLAAGPKSSSAADRYQVIVHVSAETLESDPPARSAEAGNGHRRPDVSAETPDLFTPEYSWIENGPHVSAETAQRLACDASLLRVTEGADGEPLNIGRKTRSIPPAIRRALQMRDDGCRFPGCTHKYFVDGHHIRHWADGGETSLDNLVLLCRFHHRLLHEGGFSCARKPDGRIVFTNPFGDEIPESAETAVPAERDAIDWLKVDLDHLHIDSDTGACRWQGEAIDWALAVGHLFDRRAASG